MSVTVWQVKQIILCSFVVKSLNRSRLNLYTFDCFSDSMNRKTVFLASITVILLTAGLLAYLNRHAWEQPAKPAVLPVEVQFAGNEPRITDFAVDARIESTHLVNIAFEVGGKLEQGMVPLEQGVTFKKGQLLCQVNNREAFAAMNRDKAQLATVLVQLLPEIEAQFPAEKNKWVRFMEELKPQFLLPELPRFTSSKERYFITEKGILTAFYALQQAEVKMTHYFYLAPFDGTVLSVSRQPGNIISAHQAVAQIGIANDVRISAYVSEETVFGNRKTIYACLPGGDTIGKVVFRFRQAYNGSPARCTFDLEPYRKRTFVHGMSLILKTTGRSTVKSCSIPVSALDRDLVQVVKNGRLQTRRITIVGRKDDSVFVTGLANGEAVALEYRFKIGPDTQVKQIEAQE